MGCPAPTRETKHPIGVLEHILGMHNVVNVTPTLIGSG